MEQDSINAELKSRNRKEIKNLVRGQFSEDDVTQIEIERILELERRQKEAVGSRSVDKEIPFEKSSKSNKNENNNSNNNEALIDDYRVTDEQMEAYKLELARAVEEDMADEYYSQTVYIMDMNEDNINDDDEPEMPNIENKEEKKKWGDIEVTNQIKLKRVDQSDIKMVSETYDRREDNVLDEDEIREGNIKLLTSLEFNKPLSDMNYMIPPDAAHRTRKERDLKAIVSGVKLMKLRFLPKGTDLKTLGPESKIIIEDLMNTILIEYELRERGLYSLLDLGRMDVPITVNQEGINYPRSPDFIIGSTIKDGILTKPENLDGFIDGLPVGTIIEFKMMTKRRDHNYVIRERNQLYLYYNSWQTQEDKEKIVKELRGNNGHTQIIFLDATLGSRYLYSIRDKRVSTVVTLLAQSLLDIRSETPKSNNREKKDKSSDPQPDFLGKTMKDFIIKEGGEYNIKDLNLEPMMRTPEEHAKECIPAILKMEAFLNTNYLAAEDMGDIVLNSKFETPNVWKEHPWDQDLNRARNKEENDEDPDKGFRANWVMNFPAMWQSLDISINEMEFLSKTEGKPGKLWEMAFKCRALTLATSDERVILKEIQKTKAFIKSHANDENFEAYAKEFNCQPNESSILESIANRTKDTMLIAKDKINSNPIIKGTLETLRFTEHGHFNFGVDNEVMREAGIQKRMTDKWKKKEANSEEELAAVIASLEEKLIDNPRSRSQIELADYFSGDDGISEQIAGLTGVFDSGFHIVDLMDAYPESTMQRNICNLLETRTEKAVNEVLETNGCKIMNNLFKATQSIMLTAPRAETKRMLPQEVIDFQDPSTGVGLMMTKSPNEDMSGAIIYYGKITRSEYEQIRTFQWIGPLHWIVSDQFAYYISKSVRISWPVANQCESIYWGALMTAISSNLMKQPIHHDNLYWSIFYNFSRQKVYALDKMYTLTKAAFESGTFGAKELAKKFKGFEFRDVTATTMIYRMLKNHRVFSRAAYQSSIMDSSNQMKGIKHSVFDVELSGWSGLLLLIYAKQCFPTDDGADEAYILGQSFYDNMEYEDWHLKSLFHSKNYTWYRDKLTKLEFLDMLTEDANYTAMKPWGYDGMVCHDFAYYSAIKAKLSNEAIDYKLSRGMWSKPVLEATAPTKTGMLQTVLDITGHNRVTGMSRADNDVEDVVKPERGKNLKEKREEKKPRIPGHASIPTDSAQIRQSAFHRKLLKDRELLKSLFPKGNIPKYFHPKRQLTMEEMVLLDLSIFPSCMVLTFHLKDQKGYDKRAFFCQMIMNRNGNVLWDHIGRPLLIHGTTENDLIMVKGMKRYIKMQKSIDRIRPRGLSMAVTSDKTKFGDTIPVETMQAQAKGWLRANYITEHEYNVVIAISKSMKQRIMLMPASIAPTYEKVNKLLEESRGVRTEKVLEVRGAKYVLALHEDKEGFMAKALNSQLPNTWLNESRLTSPIVPYPKFSRSSGWTLGVMNINSSCCSSNIADLKRVILSVLMYNDTYTLVMFHTHSDDSEDKTTFPTPHHDIFSMQVLEHIREDLFPDGVEIGERKYSMRGDIMDIVTKTGKIIKKDARESVVMSKFYLAMEFFVPRLFGQRSSPLKTAIGSASEIMQTVSLNNGRIYVPWARYFSSIYAGGDGSSPTDDSKAGAGAIYNLVVNGAPADIIHLAFKIVNSAVSFRFGLGLTRSNVEPVQSGGFYYSSLDHMLLGGFQANETRLLLWGRLNNSIRRFMTLMINVPEIWKPISEHASTSKLGLPDAHLFAELMTIVTEKADAEMGPEGAFETFKNFMIKFNRFTKTIQDTMNLIEIEESFLRGDAKEFSELKGNQLLEVVNRRFGMHLFLPDGGELLGALKIILKYKSPSYSESHVRVSGGTLWISRRGYHSRLVPWPFSELITVEMSKMGIIPSDKITIGDVFKNLRTLASNLTFEIPNKCLEAARALDEVNSGLISHTLSKAVTMTVVKREGSFDDMDVRYQELDTKSLYSFMDKDMFLMTLIVWHDRLEMESTRTWGNKELNEIITMKTNPKILAKHDPDMYVFKIRPELQNNKKFIDQLESTRLLLLRFSLMNFVSIRQNARLLMSLFSSRGFHGVALFLRDKSKFYDWAVEHMQVAFAWDEMLDFQKIYGFNKVEAKAFGRSDLFNIIDTSRVITMALAEVKRLEDVGINLGKLSIKPGFKFEAINVESMLEQAMTLRNIRFNGLYAAGLLASMMWVANQGGLKFTLTRCRVAEKLEIYLVKFSNWGEVAVMRTEESIKKGRLNDETQRSKWSIFADKRGNTSTGKVSISRIFNGASRTPAEHALSIAVMLSYATTNKMSGMRSIEDLDDQFDFPDDLDGNLSSVNIYQNGGYLDVRPIIGSKNTITRKAFYLYYGDLKDMFIKLGLWDDRFVTESNADGPYLPVRKTYTDKIGDKPRVVEFEHVISPWKFKPMPDSWAIFYTEPETKMFIKLIEDSPEPEMSLLVGESYIDEFDYSLIQIDSSMVEFITKLILPSDAIYKEMNGVERVKRMRTWELKMGFSFTLFNRFISNPKYIFICNPSGGSDMMGNTLDALKFAYILSKRICGQSSSTSHNSSAWQLPCIVSVFMIILCYSMDTFSVKGDIAPNNLEARFLLKFTVLVPNNFGEIVPEIDITSKFLVGTNAYEGLSRRLQQEYPDCTMVRSGAMTTLGFISALDRLEVFNILKSEIPEDALVESTDFLAKDITENIELTNCVLYLELIKRRFVDLWEPLKTFIGGHFIMPNVELKPQIEQFQRGVISYPIFEALMKSNQGTAAGFALIRASNELINSMTFVDGKRVHRHALGVDVILSKIFLTAISMLDGKGGEYAKYFGMYYLGQVQIYK